MRPDTDRRMQEAHENGDPVMRTLFYEFPQDARCWQEKTADMYGSDLLVRPVTEDGARSVSVYLPAGCQWKDVWTGTVYEGGQDIMADAPLDKIPLFLKIKVV